MMRNIAQNDQKSTRIILGCTGFFDGPLVLELWLIVDQVALIQSVAYALWYTVAGHVEPASQPLVELGESQLLVKMPVCLGEDDGFDVFFRHTHAEHG